MFHHSQRAQGHGASSGRVVRDGVLQSRATGRPVAEFLPRHAKLGLTPEESAFFVDLLTRVERKVHSGG